MNFLDEDGLQTLITEIKKNDQELKDMIENLPDSSSSIEYVIAGQKEGTTLGTKATAEGNNTTSSGDCSHAEGYSTEASGNYSHAEGCFTKAGDYSHAEGYGTKVEGWHCHGEGYYNESDEDAQFCHIEGHENKCTGGIVCHVEGHGNEVSGYGNHVEGYQHVVTHNYGHFSGYGNKSSRNCQTVFGKYNSDNENALFIIGNGSSADDRKNLFEVTKNNGIFYNGEKINLDNELPDNIILFEEDDSQDDGISDALAPILQDKLSLFSEGNKIGLKIGDIVISEIYFSTQTYSCTAINAVESLSLHQDKTKNIEYEILPHNCTDVPVFNSSDKTVATIDSNGKISPVTKGDTTITITCGSISKEILLTVTDPLALPYDIRKNWSLNVNLNSGWSTYGQANRCYIHAVNDTSSPITIKPNTTYKVYLKDYNTYGVSGREMIRNSEKVTISNTNWVKYNTYENIDYTITTNSNAASISFNIAIHGLDNTVENAVDITDEMVVWLKNNFVIEEVEE